MNDRTTIRPRKTLRPTAHDAEPPCVLVGEDDEELRRMIVRMLRRNQLDVIEASDGAHLLEHIVSGLKPAAPRGFPDLILTDVRMPGFSGIEVLRWLRSADHFTPVIVFTGFGSEGVHRLAAELGAAAVLDKPFPMGTLEQHVRRALMRVA